MAECALEAQTDALLSTNPPTTMPFTLPTPATAAATDPRPAVLILGAAGRLGAAATQAFAAAGWRVLAQQRRAEVALPPGVQRLALALDDTAGLVQAAQGARAVVYGINPLYTRWETELLPLARQGMAVAQGLDARFLLPGNVYNFGAGMPSLLQEDTPQHPTTRQGELRVALEAELAERGRRGLLRSSVIRAGDFYGSGVGSWLDLAVAKDVARGRLVYPGPLDRPHAWAYLPDLARAFVAVAAHDDPRAVARWHLAGHTLTGAQWLDEVESAARALGLGPASPWRRGGMPWGLIRLAGWVWPMGRALADMRYLWEVPHRLDGHTLADTLGPLPGTPVARALRASLAALHGQPQPLAEAPQAAA